MISQTRQKFHFTDPCLRVRLVTALPSPLQQNPPDHHVNPISGFVASDLFYRGRLLLCFHSVCVFHGCVVPLLLFVSRLRIASLLSGVRLSKSRSFITRFHDMSRCGGMLLFTLPMIPKTIAFGTGKCSHGCVF